MSIKNRRLRTLFLILFVFLLIFSHVSYSHPWVLSWINQIEQFVTGDDRTYIYSNYKKDDNVKIISFNVATAPLDSSKETHL